MFDVVQRRLPRNWSSYTDQIVASFSNFAVSAVIAHFTGPKVYGAYALATLLWYLGLGAQRALVVDPMTVLVSRFEGEALQRHMLTCYWRAVWFALASGVVTLIAVLPMQFLGGPANAMLALAIVLPFLLIQDASRWQSLSLRNGRPALRNDIVFAVIEIALALLLAKTHHLNATTGLLAIGFGAAVASVYGAFQYRIKDVMWPWHIYRYDTAGMSRWLLGDFICTWSASRATIIVVAAWLGQRDAGIFRSVTDLFGPQRLLQLSLLTVLLPTTAGMFKSSGIEGVRKTLYRSLRILGVAGGLYSLVCGLAGPYVLEHLYGRSYHVGFSITLPIAAGYFCLAMQIPFAVSLKGTLNARAMALTRIVMTPVTFVVFAVMCDLFGITGAAWATFFTWLVMTVALAWQVRHSFRKASKPLPAEELALAEQAASVVAP